MRLFRHLLDQLRRRLKPVRGEQSLQKLLEGYRGTALLYLAAKLKIADLLMERPRNCQELSQILKAHAPTFHRILRGLVAIGFCLETDDGCFQLTPLGKKLQSNIGSPAYDLAILNGEEYTTAWNNLLHSVMTGKTAFDLAFGESPWEHRQRNPDLNQHFHAWLEQGALSASQAILETYNFSSCRTIADIGGGQGTLLIAILQVHQSMKGLLLDQAHVISSAHQNIKAAGLQLRCQLIEGNFLNAIPPGADVYILKSILHDWNDEKCLLLLKNCRNVLKSGQPLLVVEKIMPTRAIDHPAIIMSDLHMLAVTGGMERTAEEYKKLFAVTGFELKKITQLKTGHSLLEVLAI
jgi:ubiquinone/menaquinone biosynthesis C-methylase UbiE